MQQRTKPRAAGDEPPLALIQGFRLDKAHGFGVFKTSRRGEELRSEVAIGSMVGGVAAVFHDMAAGMGVRIWSRERLAIKSCTVQTRSRNIVRAPFLSSARQWKLINVNVVSGYCNAKSRDSSFAREVPSEIFGGGHTPVPLLLGWLPLSWQHVVDRCRQGGPSDCFPGCGCNCRAQRRSINTAGCAILIRLPCSGWQWFSSGSFSWLRHGSNSMPWLRRSVLLRCKRAARSSPCIAARPRDPSCRPSPSCP